MSTHKPHCEAVGVSEVVSQRPMRGQLWASAVFFTWGESSRVTLRSWALGLQSLLRFDPWRGGSEETFRAAVSV